MPEPQRIAHYEVVRRLGAGSHGVVYYAWDSELLRPVVLKILKGRPSDARRRTWREARLSSAIEHPNVCAIHGVGEHDGRPYIVMQFVPGRPLADLIDEGPLSLPLGLSLATQIADGLQAAHSLGIIHRDLKPSNVLVTEGGLAKILDFGLAVRRTAPTDSPPETSVTTSPSGPLGTVGYMAPEQFVGRSSDEKTDLFALGVILYLMLAGSHPFDTRGAHEQIASAIQFRDPIAPRQKRAMPDELDRLIRLALAKAPADRVASAGAFADALRSVGKQHKLGAYSGVGQALPALSHSKKKSRSGFVRALAELVHRGPRPSSSKQPSVAVLPFLDGRTSDDSIDVGIALADALSGRLSKLPGIVIRPSGSLLSRTTLPSDPLEAGVALGVTHILSGSLAAAGDGLLAAWQLVDVDSGRIVGGDVTQMSSLDLVELQSRVSEDVFASLRGSGVLQSPIDAPAATLSPAMTESYLAARALLHNFVMRTRRRSDLDRATQILRNITVAAPDFAPAQSGLGIAELQYARNGFGDAANVARARDALERAISIDAGSLEAKLFRVYTFLALGEKESARHAVLHLLETASGNYDVHNIAATVLRLDGYLDAALKQLDAALRAEPNNAHVIYGHRARIFHYEGNLVSAVEEVERGLALLPDHPLLRVTRGYLHLRNDEIEEAIEMLEGVATDVPTLGLVQPTLAMARARSGDLEDAHALLTPSLVAAAECDPEMAYRLATFYALIDDADEALRWLRLAIYLGNENHLWFASNPLWSSLREDERFEGILSVLVEEQARHVAWWRRVL